MSPVVRLVDYVPSGFWDVCSICQLCVFGEAAPGEPVWNTSPLETWTWILNDSISFEYINFEYVNFIVKFARLPSIPTPDVLSSCCYLPSLLPLGLL